MTEQRTNSRRRASRRNSYLSAKKIRERRKTVRFLAVSLFVMLLSIFFTPQYVSFYSTGDNIFHVYINSEKVGTLGSREDAQRCFAAARRNVTSDDEDIVYLDADFEIRGEEVLFGRLDKESKVIKRMAAVLNESRQNTLDRCFTVKLGDYTINLRSEEDVQKLLAATLSQYDPGGKYTVNLIQDTSRELNVYTSEIISSKAQEQKEEKSHSLPIGGVLEELMDYISAVTPTVGKSFDDYELGLQSIRFAASVEVVEAYMPASRITDLEEAIKEVNGDVSRNQVYEVVSGDTLSGIAEKCGITVAELVANNEILQSENSVIRPGDELMIKVAEHKLPVEYTNQIIYEEDYEADTIYKDNSSWYSDKQVVIQNPVLGHRKVVSLLTYRDGNKEGNQIVMEETQIAAVPKIIERGTMAPPSYIWPVSGGRISSNYGNRKAPKAGASTNHQGVDIAVPTGTAVAASCGGKVTVAGWQGGYGYVVYIEHPNGITTRYGHLSKVLVKVGQQVSQGTKIALSGNTGNSTGPHLHFEYRINGVSVNPLNYVRH